MWTTFSETKISPKWRITEKTPLNPETAALLTLEGLAEVEIQIDEVNKKVWLFTSGGAKNTINSFLDELPIKTPIKDTYEIKNINLKRNSKAFLDFKLLLIDYLETNLNKRKYPYE